MFALVGNTFAADHETTAALEEKLKIGLAEFYDAFEKEDTKRDAQFTKLIAAMVRGCFITPLIDISCPPMITTISSSTRRFNYKQPDDACARATRIKGYGCVCTP